MFCFSATAEPPARNRALLPGRWGPRTRHAGLGRSDTCMPVSLGGPWAPARGGNIPKSISGGVLEDLVLPNPRPPLHGRLWDGAFTSLPGTPKAGGESGRFSVSGTHNYLRWIRKGDAEVKLGFLLASDSAALPQALGGVCAWARTGDLSSVTAFHPALAGPVITVTRGGRNWELHQ